MTISIRKWLIGGQVREKEITLEDVVPLHPEEYPARNLKRKLDERRAQSQAVASLPTGMLDGSWTMC
jgi:hypothetical protein